jgi:hypothetical protein
MWSIWEGDQLQLDLAAFHNRRPFMASSPIFRLFLAAAGIAVCLLLWLQFSSGPVHKPLPREYDIDKFNALVAQAAPSPSPPTTLPEWRDSIIGDMTGYLEKYKSVGYSAKDVAECAKHLDQYIVEIHDGKKQGNQDYILATSKKLVLALNDLNERCGHGLIETMEREALIEMIDIGAKQAGYEGKTDFHDVILAWRKW